MEVISNVNLEKGHSAHMAEIQTFWRGRVCAPLNSNVP